MDLVFFYLLLVFLPTQLGLHFWPAWSMVLGRRVDYLSPTLYLTDIIICLIVICWIFQNRKKLSIINYQLSIKIRNFQFAIVFLLFVFLNIFFATNRFVSLYFWLKVLEYALLGFYIYKTKPPFSKIIYYASFGVLYSSLIAIGQFFFQRSLGGPFWFLGERAFSAMTPGIAVYNFCWPLRDQCQLVLRAYATLPHPNVLGGFLAILLTAIFNFQSN